MLPQVCGAGWASQPWSALDSGFQHTSRNEKLEMTGEQIIPAEREVVWDALNDPEVLRACIPGCDKIEKISDTEYRIAMVAAVGPVKARFNGKLLLADIVPAQGYALSFEGSGGVAGFGKGRANVALASQDDGRTRLDYTARAEVGGKIAQVGSRLIDGIARKIAAEFFDKFGALIAARQNGATAAQ